jgi:hypothetical protein
LHTLLEQVCKQVRMQVHMEHKLALEHMVCMVLELAGKVRRSFLNLQDHGYSLGLSLTLCYNLSSSYLYGNQDHMGRIQVRNLLERSFARKVQERSCRIRSIYYILT